MIDIATPSGLRLVFLMASVAMSSVGDAQSREDLVRAYRATYALFDGDNRVGRSEFSLSYGPEPGRYVFESRSEFRGWLWLLSPRPIVERSEFTITAGRVRPARFVYEDGSRGGRRNFQLDFDWDTRTVRIARDSAVSELPLPAGALDPASLRVALMLDLALGTTRGAYDVADRDGIERYEFRVEAAESVATAIGQLAAERTVLARPGSSRRTMIWAAPELAYLTARMEQQRDDRDAVAFVLESVEWRDGQAQPPP